MPLNAFGWTTEEDEQLAALVETHSFLYNAYPSRKNILARESTWQKLAQQLSKPVEECKKRWRGLRDGYMRSKRMGTMHKTKAGLFEKLQFLDGTILDSEEILEDTMEEVVDDENVKIDTSVGIEQQVITDNQEYYEITVVDGPQETTHIKPFIKIMPKMETNEEPPKKIRRNGGRKNQYHCPRTYRQSKFCQNRYC